MEIIKW